MKPIKLGIIGCGLAARELHLPALIKLNDKFEIAAVCNHSEKKARSFAELVGGVPFVLDYRDLLTRADIEAVDIILPIELNCQVTKESLETGKHVLVEKPLAVNLVQAKKMLDFPNRFNQKMMVAENCRYRPLNHRTKNLLDSGIIGTPHSVFWNIFHFVDLSNKYAQTEWRINHKYKGGFITDGGVHQIATLRELFGDFISGSAFTKCINPEIGELDSFSLQFKTDSMNGVLNIFVSSNGYAENKMIILGDKGTIIIEDNKLTIKQNSLPDKVEIIEDDGGYMGQFEDFYQAIRNNKDVVSTFEKAYGDLAIIIEAIEAAETDKNIKFTRLFISDIKIERNPDEQRLTELGIKSWSIWEKETSEFPWYYDSQETCYFLEGDVEVTPEGGEAVEMGKGDLVTFPKGMACIWKIKKDVRKHYFFGDQYEQNSSQ